MITCTEPAVALLQAASSAGHPCMGVRVQGLQQFSYIWSLIAPVVLTCPPKHMPSASTSDGATIWCITMRVASMATLSGSGSAATFPAGNCFCRSHKFTTRSACSTTNTHVGWHSEEAVMGCSDADAQRTHVMRVKAWSQQVGPRRAVNVSHQQVMQ